MYYTPLTLPINRFAQIVRPYDPNTAPPPAAATTDDSMWPLVGLGIAAVVVIGLVVFVLKKRR